MDIGSEPDGDEAQCFEDKAGGWSDDSSQSNSLSDELIDFLSDNKKHLTLEFLKNLHKTFSALQRQQPDKNFNQILNNLIARSNRKEADSNSTPDHILKELEVARLAQRSAELKLQFMRQKHEEELSLVNDISLENVHKNPGVRDYQDKLTERKKVNDDLVERLRKELEHKNKKIDDLEDRCQLVEKQCQENLKALKEAQRQSRRNLESNHQYHQHQHQRSYNDRSSNNQHSILNMSPAPLFDENNEIPPPPPLGEMQADSNMDNDTHESFSGMLSLDGLDGSIPPPPDVPIDDFFKELNSPTSSAINHNHSGKRIV